MSKCLVSVLLTLFLQLRDCGTDSSYGIDHLLDDMEDLYQKPGHLELNLQASELVGGLHCAVKRRYEKKWYRAEVTAVEEGLVEVFLLDFSITEVVPSSGQQSLLLNILC